VHIAVEINDSNSLFIAPFVEFLGVTSYQLFTIYLPFKNKKTTKSTQTSQTSMVFQDLQGLAFKRCHQ